MVLKLLNSADIILNLHVYLCYLGRNSLNYKSNVLEYIVLSYICTNIHDSPPHFTNK